MAMNWQVFKTRALTAIIFVVVMMGGLLWNEWSFVILFTIVHFGAWMEYQKIVCLINPDYKEITAAHKYAVQIGGWCLLLFFTNRVLQIGNLSLADVGLWLGIAVMIFLPFVMFMERKYIFFKNIFYSIFGLLYISLPLALLVDLRTTWSEENYRLSMTIPLLIIFSLWINDTMAYVVGSFIGKTPLTKISPKKTWEGTIGGVILTVIVICLLAHFTKRIDVMHAGVMAAIAAIAGTFGDLFESKLKRMAGIKDSGNIMPGHGGFLDRFDSLLFAVVAVWFYAKWFFGEE